jgi:glycosyltransferase involved in cell wall biosynthesis
VSGPKLLVLAASYPWAARKFGGIFNERSVLSLKAQCESVEVLCPRPYVPPGMALLRRRWHSYSSIRSDETQNGVRVFRPGCVQIPGIGSSFWLDRGAFLQCRRLAVRRHKEVRFDAILAFDLLGTGGIAWRLGKELGLVAGGWATGGDVRVPSTSRFADVVRRVLQELDVVFYQSHELRQLAGTLMGRSAEGLDEPKHVVLPRGIAGPPPLRRTEIRESVRAGLNVGDGQCLILTIGRLTRPKGVFDLVRAFALAADQDRRLHFVMVGADTAFDESESARDTAGSFRSLDGRFSILPACPPEKIWDFLCAADIFAFASHHEGMPNSLLEAMAVGLPAVAFAIPSVLEIEGGTGSLLPVPPFDCRDYAARLLELSASASLRTQIGTRAQEVVRSRFDISRNMAAALLHLGGRVNREETAGHGSAAKLGILTRAADGPPGSRGVPHT